MDETDQKENINRVEARKWQFWFILSFSLFLIITFVYYLPLRFLHQAVTSEGEMHKEMEEIHEEMGQMHEGEEMHGEEGIHGKEIYHEENEVRVGLGVNLNVTPVPITGNVPTRLDFFVNEKPGNVPVPTSALDIDSTKYMHVIGVRSDLNEFFHIHPEPLVDKPNTFSIDYAFKKPGQYKIWSEIKKDGTDHIFGHPVLDVGGEGERPKKEVVISRSAIVDSYQVLIHYDEPIAKGRNINLHFEIHDSQGREVALEPYLEAQMHLSIIRDDWKQFIHTHPLVGAPRQEGGFTLIPAAQANGAHSTPGGTVDGVPFAIVFSEAGLYKAFAQFRPRGIDLPEDEALLVNFWIEVQGQTPLGISVWWGLLLASIILMAILSWRVNKYITVKSK